jgi:hypothetical protein
VLIIVGAGTPHPNTTKNFWSACRQVGTRCLGRRYLEPGFPRVAEADHDAVDSHPMIGATEIG